MRLQTRNGAEDMEETQSESFDDRNALICVSGGVGAERGGFQLAERLRACLANYG